MTDIKSGRLKNALGNLFGTRTVSLINDGDEERVENYFKVLDKTGDKALAYQSALNGASDATKRIALTSADAEAALKAMANATTKVTIAEKAAVIGTKALGVALNVPFNVVSTLAISALVKGIMKWINAEKEAEKAANELRSSGHDVVESLNNEIESLDNVIQKYVELYTHTNDLSTIKSELSEIQDELNSKYDAEANGIDVVNGKLSEEIEKMRQLKKEQAEAFVYDKENEKRYKQAVESLNGTGDETDLNYVLRDSYTTLDVDGSKFTADVHKAWSDAGLKYQEAALKWSDTSRTLHVYGSLEEQKDTLYEMAEIYRNMDNCNEDIYNRLMQQYEVVKQKYDVDREYADYYELQKSDLDNFDLPDELKSKFYSLIDEARELNQIIQGDGTAIEKYAASRDLESIREGIYRLVGANTELKDIADSTFSGFETGASNAITSIKDFASVFSEYLDGSFKDTLSNVEKVESAMQTIANGDSLDWETFRELNWGIDVDHILGAFNQVDDGYTKLNGDISDLIALKDKIINQQIQTIQNQISGEEGMTVRIAGIQADIEILEGKLSHSQSESDAKYYKGLIAEKKQDIKDINRTISDNNILIKELKRHLGDTVDHAEALNKQLEKLNEQLDEAQKKADAYVEAFTTKIDNIIDGLEEQKDVLESQKDTMEEQLDVLESQQETLEETIENYKKITDVVSSAVDDEIELLKEQQKAQEDAYNAKIEALKEAHDRQDEENQLTEKQVALQEKLRDLERARNTKVLTYSSARGWHFDVDKDAVATAEKAVNEAQKSIYDYTAEQAYKEQIKSIEDERDAVIDSYDAQITAYEEYIKQWEDILDEETKAENERLAMEILGSDWREKIKNKDLQTLNNYRVGYQNYNTQLSNLVNVEIAALKESIKAKEAEIKVIGNHITEWNKYKDAVTKAVNEIKGANEEYAQLMAQIPLDENSSYEQRLNALANFKNQFSVYTDEIAYYASQISNIEAKINIDSNVHQVSQEMANFIDNYRDAIGAIGSGIVSQLVNTATALRGYSSGGLVDYTGLAMLHGTKQNPEMVLNSQQSQELFKMINGNSFATAVAAKAADGISQLIKSPVINTTNNSNSPRITIERMDINGVQNPVDFAKQFSRNIEEYWKTKTIESYTKR